MKGQTGILVDATMESPLDVRRYVTVQTKRRLHPNAFRESVVLAYDQNFTGTDQDYRVHMRSDILQERDGPMLRHELQELDGWNIKIPHRHFEKPDSERLAVRFSQFLSA